MYREFTLLSAALLLATIGDGRAQESGTGTIDEIQVTGTRRAVDTGDVSAALTIVSSEEIAAGKLMTDALAAEVGIFVQQTTPGQGAAIIRGLKGSELLHIVDGFRLNNAIFRNAPTQYLALVSPGTADRIEIVRGAPTSLYGSDAAGGVVQVLSRFPAFEVDAADYRRDVFVAYDSAESAKIVRASLDAGNRKLAGLISAEYMDTGDRRVGGGGRIRPSAFTSKGARIALVANPDESQSWLLDYQFARQPGTPRIDELVPGFGQTDPSSSEFLFAPNERQFAHLRYTRDEGLWSAKWALDAGWQRIVDDRINRDFQSVLRRHESNRSDLYGVTLSASGVRDYGSWIVGTEVYHDRVASERFEEDTTGGPLRSVQSRFPDGSTVDQAAVFGNLLRRFGERNTLSGGIRFSTIDVELARTSLSPAATVGLNDFSGEIGWINDLSDTVQLLVNIGNGFRAPNVFDLGTLGARPGNRFNIPNTGLTSERVTQFDAGLRFRNDRMRAETVLYRLHYTDRITSVLTGETTPEGRDIVQSRNLETADIWGVEAGLDYQIGENLLFAGVINYTFGEQTEESGATVAGDRIPPLNGQASLRYDVTPELATEALILFAGRQDRLSPRDVRDVRINPEGTAGWSVLNLEASWYPDDRWLITLAIRNLLDRSYRSHGSGIDAPGRSLAASMQFVW